jgi:hypothetical protein
MTRILLQAEPIFFCNVKKDAQALLLDFKDRKKIHDSTP